MKTLFIAVIASALSACAPATSTDAAADVAPADPVCTAIMDRCHPFVATSTAAADCHTIAESNDGTMCRARQADCLATCVAATDASVEASTDAAMNDVMDDMMDVDHHAHGG